jgi:hypothetical protein
MNPRRSKLALLALLALGLGLMLPFRETLTLAAGLACLVAFIVLGVFVIAEPGFLAGDDE